MKIRLLLLLVSVVVTLIFTQFSYSVAKEHFTKSDFDTTVKLQNHVPRKFDRFLSLFSLLGSAEVTVGIVLILSLLSLIRWKWLASLGWLLIFPATLGEVFGKLVLYHPAPPIFLHRSTLPTNLPSFYINTDYSYPSGHMTRTIFLITALSLLVIFSKNNLTIKFFYLGLLITIAFLMGLTRVYLGEHWLSDVIGGGLLGVAAGCLASVLILPKKSLNITSLLSRG